MKQIEYTQHLKYRMEIRGIPDSLPEDIYLNADERYHDNATDYNIALKKVEFKGKTRFMAVTYEETSDKISLVTIHPVRENEKANRIQHDRWVKI